IQYFFFSSTSRHTRSKRDWSSDVCSSDLVRRVQPPQHWRLPPSSYHTSAALFGIEIWIRTLNTGQECQRKNINTVQFIFYNAIRSEERRLVRLRIRWLSRIQ